MTGICVICIGGFGCDPGNPREEGKPVPADQGIEIVRAEKIDEFTPAGLQMNGPIESIADGHLTHQHTEHWDFVVPQETDLYPAAEAIRLEAIRQGWSGEGFDLAANYTVPGVTLRKRDLELDITYHTSASFVEFDGDEDQLRIDISITAPLYPDEP